jgi:Flp pilus assembly protein TadD
MAMDQPRIDRPSRFVLGLLLLVAVLPYLNALTAGFTLDDWPNIRENPAVTKGVDPTEILATPLPMLACLYRPVTVLTFAVNEAVAPGNAAGFHLVNVLLHAGVTVLVYWLGIELFAARTALIAAVLFALHPLHTEAVTSIVGRAELLVAFFGLLALLSTGAADAAEDGRAKRCWYGCSVLCFAVALFSKENAVTLLPLLLLYRVTRRGEPLFAGMWKETWSLYWVPYALCLGVFFYFRFLVIGTLGGLPANRLTPLDNVLGFVPWPVRIRSALGILWDYFGLLNFPLVLSADYSFNQVPIVTSWLALRCLAGVLLCAAGAVAMVRCRPAVRFSVAVPFVALLLTANLLFPIGTIKAERLLYFPSLGWALMAAVGFDQLLRVPRYRSMGAAVLMLVCVAFTARTWTRNRDWHDDLTLARSQGASAPASAKALSNFGLALLKQGHRAAAIEEFHSSLAIYPMDESALGIGTAFREQGQDDEAIAWFHKALEIAPGLTKAHLGLCYVLWQRGDFAGAARACRNGLRYAPADANLLKGLGASLEAAGETEKATAVLRRSSMLDPDDNGLHNYIASPHTAVARRNTNAEVLR